MMDLTKLKKLVIGGIELKQLLINGVQVWKSGYKNWVKYSTEADGVTIYNGGLGYKNGYRMIRLQDYIDGIIDVELGKSPIVLTFDDGTFQLTETKMLSMSAMPAVRILDSLPCFRLSTVS